MFNKTLDEARAGENVGILLRGLEKERCRARYGSVRSRDDYAPYEVQGGCVRSDKRRGRPAYAVLQRISSSVLLQNDGRHWNVQLPEGVEMVMPGDNVELLCELIAPIAMEPQMRFAIREGGRTIGAGTVSQVIAVKGCLAGWEMLFPALAFWVCSSAG